MEWIKVFSCEDEARNKLLTNKPQLLLVNRKRICLVLHNNKFYAVQDACSHQGESLSKGNVNYLGEIICPLHNYQFNLTNGMESGRRSRDIITFPLRIDPSGFFVGI